jgi:hypothetical protein
MGRGRSFSELVDERTRDLNNAVEALHEEVCERIKSEPCKKAFCASRNWQNIPTRRQVF